MLTSPEFELEPITPVDIPAEAARTFWVRSGRYTDSPRLILPEFSQLLRISGPGEITTYIAEHSKAYAAVAEVESNAYVVDLDPDGRQVGAGEIRFALTNTRDFFRDKPFVGWTETEPGHQRQGLGKRRLLIMNLAATALYKHPLHSGTLMSDDAESLWQKLTADGLAEKYTEKDTAYKNGLVRYKFSR